MPSYVITQKLRMVSDVSFHVFEWNNSIVLCIQNNLEKQILEILFEVAFILQQSCEAYKKVQEKQQQLIEKGKPPIIELQKQKVLDVDKTLKKINIYNIN